MRQTDFSSSSELYIEPVYGLRMWRVQARYKKWDWEDFDGTPVISGVHAGYWYPGVNEASCDLMYPNHGLGAIPEEECMCGFYAYWGYPGVETELGYRAIWWQGTRFASEAPLEIVFGVIKAHGKVQVGSLGFRSERAEIVAFSGYPPRMLEFQDYADDNFDANNEASWVRWRVRDMNSKGMFTPRIWEEPIPHFESVPRFDSIEDMLTEFPCEKPGR